MSNKQAINSPRVLEYRAAEADAEPSKRAGLAALVFAFGLLMGLFLLFGAVGGVRTSAYIAAPIFLFVLPIGAAPWVCAGFSTPAHSGTLAWCSRAVGLFFVLSIIGSIVFALMRALPNNLLPFVGVSLLATLCIHLVMFAHLINATVDRKHVGNTSRAFVICGTWMTVGAIVLSALIPSGIHSSMLPEMLMVLCLGLGGIGYLCLLCGMFTVADRSLNQDRLG